jgi:hypothetical protein
MENEQTSTTDTQGKEVDTPVETGEKSVSIVDEARAIRDEIVKAKEELKAENDRKEKNAANDLLGGTTGGHVEPKEKEIDPVQYAKDALAGNVGDGKEE